ncbi:MAG: BRO family protein [Desulfobulbus sp.]|nr:BRO family protein [Desulfobulbus sp.]
MANNEVYFVAKDAAIMLGYKDTTQAIRKNCKKAQPVGGRLVDAPHKVVLDPQTNIIPESDLWRLIIKSNLPEAQKIEEWVMEEVLPGIRKNGGYISPNANADQIKTLSCPCTVCFYRHTDLLHFLLLDF